MTVSSIKSMDSAEKGRDMSRSSTIPITLGVEGGKVVKNDKSDFRRQRSIYRNLPKCNVVNADVEEGSPPVSYFGEFFQRPDVKLFRYLYIYLNIIQIDIDIYYIITKFYKS